MNEGNPEDPHATFGADAGFELQRQDREDPERGPVVRQVRALLRAALASKALRAEIEMFYTDFIGHFGDTEARKHRLLHLLIGSSPLGTANIFDAEGEWSIAAKTRSLARDYDIALPA